MRRPTIVALLLLLGASLSHADIKAEFDRGRFVRSSFNCTVNSDCNFGLCSPAGMCHCNYGYRDNTTAPCDHEMPAVDKTASWALEAGLGWIFPAGLAYEGLWAAVGIRLMIMGLAMGTWPGYFYHRDYFITELHKEKLWEPIGCIMGAVVTSALHLVGWIGSTWYLSRFDMKVSSAEAGWHKDRGFADLMPLADKVVDSARITQNLFTHNDCAIVESCIDGAGERRLLRFDAYIFNNGTADFVMGLENIKPVWSDCHQHFHGPDTANYFVEHTLLTPNGTSIKTVKRGHKQGYCYIDSNNINSDYKGKFGCGIPALTRQLTQGITAGWADLYDSDTDCQWIDITGIPAGNYSLSVTVNPKGTYFQDASLTNNEALVNVEIPPVNLKAERTRYGTRLNGYVIKGPRS